MSCHLSPQRELVAVPHPALAPPPDALDRARRGLDGLLPIALDLLLHRRPRVAAAAAGRRRRDDEARAARRVLGRGAERRDLSSIHRSSTFQYDAL